MRFQVTPNFPLVVDEKKNVKWSL